MIGADDHSATCPSPIAVGLRVANLRCAARFYGTIGFRFVMAIPDEQGNWLLCLLRWGDASILLGALDHPRFPRGQQHAESESRGPRAWIALTVPNLLATYAACTAAGCRVTAEPARLFGGDCAFSCVDLFGYEWKFTEQAERRENMNPSANEAETTQIAHVVAEVERSQNARDADRFLRLFTPDAVWVTALGRRLTGLVEISDFTRQVLTSALGDRYARYDIAHVLYIRDDVAAVNLRQRPVDRDGTPLTDEAEGSPVYVMVKQQGAWRIAVGQNTRVQQAAIDEQRGEVELR